MRICLTLVFLSALLFAGCNESTVDPNNGDPDKPDELYYTVLEEVGAVPVGVYTIKTDGTNRRLVVPNSGLLSSPVGDKMIVLQKVDKEFRPTLCKITGEFLNIITTDGGDWPLLSPDATRMLYRKNIFSIPDGQSTELRIMNTDGTNDRVIASGAAWETIPVWSPDGSRIAYFGKGSETDGLDRDSLFIVNSDGTGRRFLTAEGMSFNDNFESLDWSPDGTKLVCITETAQQMYELLVVNVASGETKKITSDGIAKAMPVWSPDSRKVAYMGAIGSQSSPISLIFSINADGTNKRDYQISTSNIIAYPQWSPSGSYIAVTELSEGSPDPSFGTLKLINTSSGAITILDSKVYRAYWKK